LSTEANKTVVRRYIEETINGGDLSLIDTFFAPARREAVRAFLTGGGDAFPDGREEIQDLVAEGDKVMARWIIRGTHQAPFLGIPATGKPIEITGYGTYYFENGQITWDTIVFDWLEAVEQLGATITPPEPLPAAP
jgi:steroid delta-isomerase-like uncharacterized protein